VGAALAAVLAIVTTTTAVAQLFPDVSRIETDLERGVSTKAEVRRLLGTPTGFGDAIWPPDHRKFDVWYYEDMEVTGMQSGDEGVIDVNMRQQLLIIFFDKDKYDGFKWTTNVIPAEIQ
jgi:hypothetical protein